MNRVHQCLSMVDLRINHDDTTDAKIILTTDAHGLTRLIFKQDEQG